MNTRLQRAQALLWLLAALMLTSGVATAQSSEAQLVQRLAQLEPVLGSYPPHLRDDTERRAVLAAYLALKAELDAQLVARPNTPTLLYLRGRLQRFGHNLDQPGSWIGATRDLRLLLTINPRHVPALLDLGLLWVHSWPALAPNAEQLFRTAQCQHGSEPLEQAQRGIFFALYFQSQLPAAARQVEYLHRTWPEQEEYSRMRDMVQTVLERMQAQYPQDPALAAGASPFTGPDMASCHPAAGP